MPPNRGEVWAVELDPTRGHKQSGRRPCVVVSADGLNRSPAGLVIVVPVTRTVRHIVSHVLLTPPEGGLRSVSAALCEAVGSLSIDRFHGRWGTISDESMDAIGQRLRLLLALP